MILSCSVINLIIIIQMNMYNIHWIRLYTTYSSGSEKWIIIQIKIGFFYVYWYKGCQ